MPLKAPVEKDTADPPVVTNKISKLHPPQAAPITPGVGISIFCFKVEVLEGAKKTLLEIQLVV